MANDYSGIKQVRAINGQGFIDDFKRVGTVVALLPAGNFFRVQKSEVWREAKRLQIAYRMTDKLYRNRRTVMAIEDCG